MNLKQLAQFDNDLTAIGFESGAQAANGSQWVWRRGNLCLCFENNLWFVRLKGLQPPLSLADNDFDTWSDALVATHRRVQSMMNDSHFPGITEE